MIGSNDRAGEWSDCTNNAWKHVVYNHQEGEAVGNSLGVRVELISTHADLCDVHILELRNRYAAVSEEKFGQCDCYNEQT
jgi:hypothetical protein